MIDMVLPNDGQRIAVAETEITALKADVKEVRDDVKAIREGQDEIREFMAKASGGLKVILWIGGAAGTIAGLWKYMPWSHVAGSTH